MMTEPIEFWSSPPKKTVRFGGQVTEVLSKYSQGNTQAFELLKHQLSDPEIKDVQIINWLRELRNSVTHLTIDYEQLVSIVLKLPWLNRSNEVVEEYLSFLVNLVSAQTVYLRSCLNMIVSHFIPSRIIIHEGDVNISDSEDEDEDIVATFNTCHRALKIIAQYVPSATRFLIPILVEKFPYVNKSPRVLECYIHNLLRITVYFPMLRLEILELVTEKLLKIDVNASRCDIENAEQNACIGNGENCSTEDGIFKMDENEDLQKRGGLFETMAHPAAERLDLVLSVLFAYIKEICFVNGLAYLQALNFERIVMCQLNPLKICLPAVVNFFAAITRKYQLVFCYTIMERNKRQIIPVIRSSTCGTSVQMCTNPLDSFFPFDSCVLKRCKKVIDPIYQPWKESNVEEFKSPKKLVKQDTIPDDDDDFLKGEMPQNDSIAGMTSGSFNSFVKSTASSVGSPPVKFLQRPF
ncbi:RNA polymerase I-specific transcription initiation factor RRN3 isoform 2-T4 [Mantella aurantiaca]